MNRANPYCTLFIALLFAASASAQEIDPPRGGRVDIDSSPRGAEVYSGDSLLGRTPCSISVRDAHAVAVFWPGRYEWSAQKRALPDSLLTADRGVMLLNFNALRTLRSTPSGSAVYSADSLLGFTPLEVRVDGNLPLRLEKPGYLPVLVDALEAAAGGSVVLQSDQAVLQLPDVLETKPFVDLPPPRIWLPAAGGIAAGIAAAYCKQHANELYGKYLRTGDESLLSETEKYDIYAGVSLAVLQIGLAYFVYLLFTER